MNYIQLKDKEIYPDNFTGIADYPSTKTRYHLKNGLLHREDGPAIEDIESEYSERRRIYFLTGEQFIYEKLLVLTKTALYLGKEMGKYDLYWFKFLTEDQGIKEFPLIPGMYQEKHFFELFEDLKE